MATNEPGQLFQFDRPLARGPVASAEVRGLFTALGQTNYTTDPTFPAAPRVGMQRINAADPNNIKWEVFQGTPGVWRTLLQNVQGGVITPAKQIVQVVAPTTTWTIDHNLGTQPIVQVFDASFRQMVPVNTPQRDYLSFGRLDLAGPAALGPIGTVPARYEGRIIEVYATTVNGVSGAAATASIQWEIDTTPSGGGVTPLSGGLVVIPTGTHPQGAVFPGSSVAGANLFSGPLRTPGQEDTLQATLVAPLVIGAGSAELYAVVERTPGPNQYFLDHPNDNRIVVTHPQATQGWVVLIG